MSKNGVARALRIVAIPVQNIDESVRMAVGFCAFRYPVKEVSQRLGVSTHSLYSWVAALYTGVAQYDSFRSSLPHLIDDVFSSIETVVHDEELFNEFHKVHGKTPPFPDKEREKGELEVTLHCREPDDLIKEILKNLENNGGTSH